MKRSLWVLLLSLPAAVTHAQTCPAANYLQGGLVSLGQDLSISGLQRQADGSFTQRRYSKRTPFALVDSTPNYQTAFLCSGAGVRTFKLPPGWAPLADRPGTATQTILFSDFLGNGTPVGLGIIPGGSPIGLSTDSLMVQLFTTDGVVKSKTNYPVLLYPNGLLVADFNKDGKKDVVVVSYGPYPTTGPASPTVSVFLGKGDGTLAAPVNYVADKGSTAAVAGDFNGDGNLDLAVTNNVNEDVSILLGKGDGTFAAPVNYPASGTGAIALGDFNGDGRLDLVSGGNGHLSVLLGNGNGTFRPALTSTVSFSAASMAVGDFNKDSKLDLAIVDSLAGTMTILLGDGTGKFAGQYDYVSAFEPSNVMVADVDGDGNLDAIAGSGHPDLLTTAYYGDTVTVFFGRGDGTLIGPPSYPVGSGLTSLALADFDGDKKVDLVVAAGNLWILFSRGDGTFKPPLKLNVQSGASTVAVNAVAAADLNGDGRQDLVVGDNFGSAVYVLLGVGDGTFQPPVKYTTNGKVSALSLGDFNGDGKLDIAAAGTGAGTLFGNGDGTFQAYKSLTGFGSPQRLLAADFNKDGKADLVIVNGGTFASASDPGGLVVYLSQAGGTFSNPVNYPAGINPSFAAAADVNGDGVLDLLVTTTSPNFGFNIGVLLGNPNGTFGPVKLFNTDFGPSWISVADLNGDGKPDLAVAHCCGETNPTFMYGNGDGTFQPDVFFTAVSSPAAVIVTDLNNDGKADLLIGTNNVPSGSITAFLNLGAQLTNVNGASFLGGTLAPDSFATAQGSGLATTTQIGTPPYTTSMGGTTVSLRDAAGVSQLAALHYVSPTQVNYIVPHGAALGQATVTITPANGASSSAAVTIGAVGPGLFVFDHVSNLLAANVLRVHADTSQSVEDVYSLNSSGALVPKPIDLGPSTDQVYLVLYATGLRGHSAAANSVTVTAAATNLPLLYADKQGDFPGLDQIDVLLPRSLAGKGDVAIQVTVDGQVANIGHVTIK